jgi:toxin ParE1/3/4
VRRRLELTEITRADLKSIRRYSIRTWGQDRTSQYMTAIRDTLKGLVRGTVPTRNRDDLRPGLQMVPSGRHCIFFEADQSRVLVVRVLHDRMDYRRHLDDSEPADE